MFLPRIKNFIRCMYLHNVPTKLKNQTISIGIRHRIIYLWQINNNRCIGN